MRHFKDSRIGCRSSQRSSAFQVAVDLLALRSADPRSTAKSVAAVRSKRFYSSSNLDLAVIAANLWPALHPLSRRVARSAAFLDVTGGDSFTDLYGQNRFLAGCQRKRLALNCSIPLILLPQTYGPFKDRGNQKLASDLAQRADSCWARDAHSFALLREMLGQEFNPERHRCGVDLAFGLEPRNSCEALSHELRALLEADRTNCPLVGLNVSGLIYNDSTKAGSRYRFKADYRALLQQFVSWLLNTTNASVVLVPHVMSSPGHYESDAGACEELVLALSEKHASRVLVSPRTLDQCQVKWLIAQTDWFCGTRMHSTIAALSSGVPTATVSYSDKAEGVFETCGQGQQVIDPRVLDTHEVVERLQHSFKSRDAAKDSLAKHLPAVKATTAEQMNAVAERIRLAVSQSGKATG